MSICIFLENSLGRQFSNFHGQKLCLVGENQFEISQKQRWEACGKAEIARKSVFSEFVILNLIWKFVFTDSEAKREQMFSGF